MLSRQLFARCLEASDTDTHVVLTGTILRLWCYMSLVCHGYTAPVVLYVLGVSRVYRYAHVYEKLYSRSNQIYIHIYVYIDIYM